MTIRVEYPSGRKFFVIGKWHGPQPVLSSPNELGTEADCVVVEDTDGVMLVLDPRGTYTDLETGKTLYRGIQA